METTRSLSEVVMGSDGGWAVVGWGRGLTRSLLTDTILNAWTLSSGHRQVEYIRSWFSILKLYFWVTPLSFAVLQCLSASSLFDCHLTGERGALVVSNTQVIPGLRPIAIIHTTISFGRDRVRAAWCAILHIKCKIRAFFSHEMHDFCIY